MPYADFIKPPSFGSNIFGIRGVRGIYVCREKSSTPIINSAFLPWNYKIGMSEDINERVDNAEHDPSFLLKKAELIEVFEFPTITTLDLYKVEKLLHECLASARIDLPAIHNNKPKEWFNVPLMIIREVIEKIENGTVQDYQYDVGTGTLVTKLFSVERLSSL